MKERNLSHWLKTTVALGLVATLAMLPAAAIEAGNPAEDTGIVPIAVETDSEDAANQLDKSVFVGPNGSTIRVRMAAQPPNGLFYGTIKQFGEEGRMAVYGVNEEGKEEAKVILTLTEQTRIIKATTGEPVAVADIRENEMVYAYTSAIMTMSLPPQTSAELILVGIPADYAAPSYVEVDTVRENAQGNIVLGTKQAINITLTENAQVFPYLTKNIVTKDMIQPGHKLLAWTGPTLTSYPAQTTAEKVMVFAYDYQGYVTLNADAFSINGELVKFNPAEMPKVDDETYLVPLRRVAEQLGYDVEWLGETGSVTVSLGGALVYQYTFGEDSVQFGEDSRYLRRKIALDGGVSYIALDDLLALHNLKMETSF